MPAFVLGTRIAGVLMRHTRSAMLRRSGRTTSAPRGPRGCGSASSSLKHALRNALIPVITLGALEFGPLLAGAVLTEQIFTIPGFGKLIVDAVFNRDYPVVQGVVLVTALIYMCSTCWPTSSTWRSTRGCAADDERATVHRRPAAGARPDAPARARAWRRLPAAPAALFGLLVVVLFIAAGGAARRGSRPTTRCATLERDPQGALARRTGSAPTRSAATCCRG